jgi:hypothetical protein
MPPHAPNWHILDNAFVDQNSGLVVPNRQTVVGIRSPVVDVARSLLPAFVSNQIATPQAALRIENLDRADPPNYAAGSVPRGSFNPNVFQIAAEPRMPRIEVECFVRGFDPATTPILWRLACRHVLCRHVNHGNYQYRGLCDILTDEWQGQSDTARFVLFDNLSSVALRYSYNGNEPNGPVMGGHAILCVAARVAGSRSPLVDFVHLRIGATNPRPADVLRYTDQVLNGRNQNVIQMVRAIFAHENNFTQFETGEQTATRMTFRQRHHQNNLAQPDCQVRFDWPNDPENFPSTTFDFGVGISQFTRLSNRPVTREIAWDWRENIRAGINEFLRLLRAHFVAGSTWRQWAIASWAPYNGAGPQAAQYAQTLANSAEGQQVANQNVPAGINLNAETALVPSPAARVAPPPWP